MKGYCTVNVDASFYPEKKKGSFAAWIICDLFSIQVAACFKGDVQDSNESELKGLINALHILSKQEGLASYTIVINCDNQVARDAVSNNKVNEKYKKLKNKVLWTLQSYFNFYPKVIKGHSNNRSGRNRVNNWCDQEARKVFKTKQNYINIVMK